MPASQAKVAIPGKRQVRITLPNPRSEKVRRRVANSVARLKPIPGSPTRSDGSRPCLNLTSVRRGDVVTVAVAVPCENSTHLL